MIRAITRRSLAAAIAFTLPALAVLSAPGAAQAQAWPNRPITWVVPFPAGGGTDAFARPLAAVIGKALNQQIVIDNRGGAGGTIGASVAARAPADGYNFFIGAAHHTIAPSLYPKLDYDLEKDFVPITVIAQPPQVIVVNPQKVEARTLADLIKYLKANPGKMDYGSAGNGTTHHLAGELFKIVTKTEITHVPYRGAGPAMQGLLAGEVHMVFDGLGTSAGQITGGRIIPLGMASPTRNGAFPNVPTTKEAGLDGYVVSTWYAMWAPKGTPADIVTKMYAETRKALDSAELKDIWAKNGSDIPTMTPAQFAPFVGSEIKRWAEVVKASGAKLD